jgi:hypothetical protein
MAFDRNVAFTICGVPAALEQTPSADVVAEYKAAAIRLGASDPPR